MDTDKGRSSSRKTSRSHKSSSSNKDRSSSRHKSSSRSHTSSGEKSKEKERSSRRSPASTPGVQIIGPSDAHGSLQKSQFSRSGLVNGDFQSYATGDDDFTLASNNSFDPIAVANQRTAYYAQHQQPPSPLPQPGALLIPSEAPSRGSRKLAGDSTMPQHSFATSSSASSAMSRPSNYKSSEPSSKVSKGTSSVYGDDATIMAHAVVPVDAYEEVSAVKEADVERLAQENRAFQEQLRAQNEIERARIIEENERIQREIRESIQRQKDEEAAKRRRQRQCMVKTLIAIAVLAAIGIGAYFGTSSSSPATAVNQSPAQTPSTPTSSPSTKTPTDDTSVYAPPNAEECENMEKGLPRGNDYQGLLNRQFDVIFNAQVSSSSESTVSSTLLSVLEQQVERLLRPKLVGCPSNNMRRNIFLTEDLHHRQLVDLDHLIYDLEVSLAQDTERTCTVDEQGTEPCHVLVASMNTWLQGDEPSLLVRGHIFEVLDNLDLPVTLELQGQFDLIVVQDVRNTSNGTPTQAPSGSSVSTPSSPPVESPSNGSSPTSSPSNRPTMAPVIGPTSPPTPPPTARPVPQLTPEPTPPPSPPPTLPPKPPPTAAPVNNIAPGGSCDLGQYFLQGKYQQFDGGVDQSYTVDCSMYNSGVIRRGIALAVDESTCNFTCVGRLSPNMIGPYCVNKPLGSTITITVIGDNTGSKIYLGADVNGREQQTLECEPSMESGP